MKAIDELKQEFKRTEDLELGYIVAVEELEPDNEIYKVVKE